MRLKKDSRKGREMIKEIDIVAHNGSIVVCKERLTKTEKEKLKENIKSIQKTMLQRIITDDGSIVETAKDTAYSRTEFDEIIAAWQKQRDAERQEHWKSVKKRNIFSLFRRKKVA